MLPLLVVAKCWSSSRSPALTHNHPLHPHAFHQPTPMATHTPRNCTDTRSTRQTKRFRHKETDRRRKQYNFPHKNARHMRQRPNVSMGIDQSNPNTCHPQFNPQPLAPIPPTTPPDPLRTLPAKTMRSKKGRGKDSNTSRPMKTFVQNTTRKYIT